MEQREREIDKNRTIGKKPGILTEREEANKMLDIKNHE